MSDDVLVKNGIIIPAAELEITASRAGGPGGQHVNKTSSRITVRWNVHKTRVLNNEQKELVLRKLYTRITSDGDFIIHSGASRSQEHNRKQALERLAYEIRNALHVPKKRMKTHLPKAVQEARLHAKKQHGTLKKLRSKKIEFD